MRKTSMLCLLLMADYCLLAQTAENLPPVSDTISHFMVLTNSDFENEDAFQYSSLLTAARDPQSAFNFSPVRFSMRGYDADLFTASMNGLPMNSPDNGTVPWFMWSGLNDVMRRKLELRGLQSSGFSFGAPGGAVQIDARACNLRPQTTVAYSLSNRNYTHRFSFSRVSAFNAKGWAWAFAASLRWAREGYIPGTFYNGKSYYLSMSKKMADRQVLSVMLLGAHTHNGRQAASVIEAKEAAGDLYYNPSWGYQQGRKRNANVVTSHRPLLSITHDYTLGERATLVTAIGYATGGNNTTGLDWYHAPDPRPDYYRYLPGYQAAVSLQQQVKQAWAEDPTVRQVNWEQLYAINTGNDNRRASYILEDRVVRTHRWIMASNFEAGIGERFSITSGISFQSQRNQYYKQVNDLLGAAFYVDINQFAERDFPGDQTVIQNDLNRPDRKLVQGDRFGYDYSIHMQQLTGWGQLSVTGKRIDVFAAAHYENSGFQRIGAVRNGLFPLQSYGPSGALSFHLPGFKTGITYKLNGRHYMFLRAAMMTKAPYFTDVFLSPRTGNRMQDAITTEKIKTVEAGYVMNTPTAKIKLTGYWTRFRDGMKVLSFYHDDYNSFVNNAFKNIGKLHYGAEIGGEAAVLPSLTVQCAAAIGRYYYEGRQEAIVTADNDALVLDKALIYIDHFRIGTTPQEAYSTGVSYRASAAWFLNIKGSCFRQQWLEINPLRRTPQAVDNIDPDSRLYREIIEQVQWPSQYTVDLFAGYNKKLPERWLKNTVLVVYAGVSNLLNNRTMVSGAYEQLRFDALEKNLTRFPPKIWYAYGINGFLNIALRF